MFVIFVNQSEKKQYLILFFYRESFLNILMKNNIYQENTSSRRLASSKSFINL